MTRILVYGSGDPDDHTFIHNSLCEINKTYGPISCVIHANHVQALAWQQWVSRRQVTHHLPVVPQPHCSGRAEAEAAWERCREAMFLARPNFVVIFQPYEASVTERDVRSQLIVFAAERHGVPVLTYTSKPRRGRSKKSAPPLQAAVAA